MPNRVPLIKPKFSLHLSVLGLISLFAVLAALSVGLESVHAQSTAPTISTVAITSSPGTNNTYATGDIITVSLTFSEAVTVTGTPYVTINIGGQSRNAAYTGGEPPRDRSCSATQSSRARGTPTGCRWVQTAWRSAAGPSRLPTTPPTPP